MPSSSEDLTKEKVKIIKTDENAKDGQNKCPKCGATDISLNINNGKLRCNFCRHEFSAESVNSINDDISSLDGQVLGSGAQDIVTDATDLVTFKCSSCGSEVVVDTESSLQARCHWCRNTLSVNQQIPNGSVPDVVLPFSIKKDDAKKEIEKFVEKRKFFAHPKFKEEFTTENIMGVYFPYMIVDINAHSNLKGRGEHLVRRYTVGSGDDRETRYDADLYEVERDFDLMIDNLTIESSADKLNKNNASKTTNVINAIMPFDIENCVKWNANYLKGYTSEKRDVNINALKPLVETQAKDIARFAANDTLEFYDRGVAWSSESLNIKGHSWHAAYLPVWLYSYQQVKGNNKVLHYVAVNARTKETMGSVPIHMPKLLLVSFIIELLGGFAMISIESDYSFIFLSVGVIFFLIMYARYRNSNARHYHELETKTKKENMQKVDNFIKHEKGLSNAKIVGANNFKVSNQSFSSQLLDSVVKNNEVAKFVNSKDEKNNK